MNGAITIDSELETALQDTDVQEAASFTDELPSPFWIFLPYVLLALTAAAWYFKLPAKLARATNRGAAVSALLRDETLRDQPAMLAAAAYRPVRLR